MKKNSFLILLAFLTGFVSAKEFPDEYYTLRDAMYNCQKTPAVLEQECLAAEEKAKETLSGFELNIALARYEYIIGRAYSYDKKTEKAAQHFDKGMSYAKAAVDREENARSLLIYAENISGNCASKPFSWVIIWGPKVGSFAKKIVKLDSKNGAGLYMQYAQDVYAPRMFSNYKRGIKEMTAVLNNPQIVIDTDDEFNLKSAVGYAWLRQGNSAQAKIWLEEALKIYPGNKFVKNLLETNRADDVVSSD